MDAKTKAIVAHFTLIGWIIALVMNSNEKDEFTSFYIRQMLGLTILGIGYYVLFFLPLGNIIPNIYSLLLLVLWVLSLVGAIQGEEKPTPVVGEYFQTWFASL